MMDRTLGSRITVVGTTATGKTTLATQLAQCLGLPRVELDALYWGPNWTAASVEDFRARVAQVVSKNEWVLDGNYSRARDLIWARTPDDDLAGLRAAGGDLSVDHTHLQTYFHPPGAMEREP